MVSIGLMLIRALTPPWPCSPAQCDYLKQSLLRGMEDSMIFIITGDGEHGPVSTSCETAVAALQQARRLSDEGVKNILIDADGQEFAPAEFKRLFVEPGPVTT